MTTGWMGVIGYMLHTAIHANDGKAWAAIKLTALVAAFVALSASITLDS